LKVLLHQNHAQLQQKKVHLVGFLTSDAVVAMVVVQLVVLVVVMKVYSSKVHQSTVVASAVAAVVAVMVSLALVVAFESVRIHCLEEAN